MSYSNFSNNWHNGTVDEYPSFTTINEQLRQAGLFGNVFHFIDASTTVTKTALWAERDKAIKDGHDKLNNLIVKDYAADKFQALKTRQIPWFRKSHLSELRPEFVF